MGPGIHGALGTRPEMVARDLVSWRARPLELDKTVVFFGRPVHISTCFGLDSISQTRHSDQRLFFPACLVTLVPQFLIHFGDEVLHRIGHSVARVTMKPNDTEGLRGDGDNAFQAVRSWVLRIVAKAEADAMGMSVLFVPDYRHGV